MGPRNEEKQAANNLYFRIFMTILIWGAVVAFGSYKLWTIRKVTKLPLSAITFSVPTLKEEAVLGLQNALKNDTESIPGTLLRPEPFD